MNTSIAIALLRERFGSDVVEPPVFRGEQGVQLPRERLVEACRVLKTECGFDMLTDLTGLDNFGDSPRFEIQYLLYSLSHLSRLRLSVGVPEEDPVVDSVCAIWGTANWHEREAFDMMGIRFTGHPDLRRILMWDGYPHHPLRKDFPVAGLPAELPATAMDAGSVEVAPMEGGPFVAVTGTTFSTRREPRACDSASERNRSVKDPHRKEEI